MVLQLEAVRAHFGTNAELLQHRGHVVGLAVRYPGVVAASQSTPSKWHKLGKELVASELELLSYEEPVLRGKLICTLSCLSDHQLRFLHSLCLYWCVEGFTHTH